MEPACNVTGEHIAVLPRVCDHCVGPRIDMRTGAIISLRARAS